METFRKIVRASQKRGKKKGRGASRGLTLSSEDVRLLAELQIVQAMAQNEAEAFCLRTKHRKQRDGLCSCKRGF